MECKEAIENTAKQVANIPDEVKRIVVAVGSGVNLAGIVNGIIKTKKDLKVLGVKIGKDPEKLLDTYSPNWRKYATLVNSGLDYHEEVNASIEGVRLDPVYEAKCKKFLEDGDLLWIIGVRQSLKEIKEPVINNQDGTVEYYLGNSLNLDKLVDGKFDLIFSCPPYYDLERYNDGEGDISMAESYEDFVKDYKKIIAKAVAKLKDNRFAIFTVANIRDTEGYYRNLVADTIGAFEEAGAKFYNDIILVNAVATASMRARRPFNTNRKVAKVHQNILVFYKGDLEKTKKSYQVLPQIHRYHENILVFYKGDINEIKENYKVVKDELFLETEE